MQGNRSQHKTEQPQTDRVISVAALQLYVPGFHAVILHPEVDVGIGGCTGGVVAIGQHVVFVEQVLNTSAE